MSPPYESVAFDDFRCPRCLGRLDDAAPALTCTGCSASYPVRDGILDLRVHRHDYYFNPVPRDEMAQLTRDAQSASWDTTVRRFLRFVRNAPDWIDNIAVNGRYSWKLFLELRPGGRFLDFGCGLGNLTQNVAPHVGEVIALDLTWERLQFAQQRFARFNTGDRIRLVAGGDGPHLPFPDAHFDAIALSGVLEWIADDIDVEAIGGSWVGKGLRLLMTFFGESNPRRTQQRFLTELHRTLKPDGELFVAIENRWGYEYFLGRPDHHSGLPAGSLLPRFVANAYSVARNHRPYRTYTHSQPGIRALFRRAGFPRQRVYGLSPGYSGLTEIVADTSGLTFWKPLPRARVAERLTHSRYFVPAFGIVAQPSSNAKPPFIARLLADIEATRPDLGALTLHDCRITGKDKVVMHVSAAAGMPLVLKIPAGAAACEGEFNARHAIEALGRRRLVPVLAPETLATGTLQRVSWFLERRIAGVALSCSPIARQEAARLVAGFVKRLATPLHESTPVDLQGSIARALVDEPIEALAGAGIERAALAAVRDRAREPLEAQPWALGAVHGDLSASNLYVDGAALSGAIDWEYARDDGLPALDFIAYLESRQRLADPTADMPSILLRLAQWDWPCAEEAAALRDIYAACGVSEQWHERLCLLAWLVHVGHQMRTSRRFDARAVERITAPMLAAHRGAV